jgi:hypothetical protein
VRRFALDQRRIARGAAAARTTSMMPRGGKGTTIRKSPCGQACALKVAGAASGPAASTARDMVADTRGYSCD